MFGYAINFMRCQFLFAFVCLRSCMKQILMLIVNHVDGIGIIKLFEDGIGIKNFLKMCII